MADTKKKFKNPFQKRPKEKRLNRSVAKGNGYFVFSHGNLWCVYGTAACYDYQQCIEAA